MLRIASVLRSPQLALAGAALFWAGNFIVGRALRGDVPPVSLAFWRWVVAGVLLIPLTLGDVRDSRHVLRREWKLLLVLAVTGMVLFHVGVYTALQTTTAVNSLLFLSLTPVLIAVGGWVAFDERLTRLQVFAILLSLLGALVIIKRGSIAAMLSLAFNPGDLWMLLAVVVWAIYSLILKKRPADLQQMPLLTATTAIGLVFLALLYGWRFAEGERLTVNAPNVLGIVYTGVFASVLAYLFWNRGVKELGANATGMYLHLTPVFGAVLSFLLLGEGIAFYHIVGGALVFGGIILMNRQPAERAEGEMAGSVTEA